METQFANIRYPDVYIQDRGTTLHLVTTLRKLHRKKWSLRGKYYLVHFKQWHNNIVDKDKGEALLHFIKEVHIFHMLGKVSTTYVKDAFGETIFKLDPDQTPEEKRLRETLNQ